MNDKKSYEKSISELHEELEQITKDLQKEKEKKDGVMKSKETQQQHLQNLKEIEDEKLDYIRYLDGLLSEQKDKLNYDIELKKEKKDEYENSLRETINYINTLRESMKDQDRVYREYLEIQNKLGDSKERLQKMQREEEVKSMSLRELQDEFNNKIAELNRRTEEVEALMEQQRQHAQAVDEARNKLKFYADRFIRLYRKRGLGIPKDVEETINKL